MTKILKNSIDRRTLAVASFSTAISLSLGKFARLSAGENDADAIATLQKASKRLADVESMSFVLEVEGDTYLDESNTMKLVHADGKMARPDMVDVNVQIEVIGQKISLRMITVGTDAWITDLVTGKWIPAPVEFGYNPAVLYDNQNGLGPVVGKLTDVQSDGTEEIDGSECDKITGVASDKTIGKLTSNTMSGDEIAIVVWVDQKTADIRKINLAEPDSEEHHATWTLSLSDYDEKVTIEPPI